VTTANSLAEERNEALLGWYEIRSRDLPWRSTTDPYQVLVSEFMLQQTQVTRVVVHYERFIERFPRVEDLAAAPLGDVLAAWSGLGYNIRAQRLRESARVIVDRGWPTDVAGLQELPGIGPYTAAALASFALGQRIPAVDTNLRRVLSRWHGEPLDGAALMAAAQDAIAEQASAWNQAMMDLGATVCRPRGPRCESCPVTAWCSGPDGYEAATAQARFEGSARQLRGAIVRSVVRGPQRFESLRRETGFPTAEIEMAIEDLVSEGLITDDGGVYRPAD